MKNLISTFGPSTHFVLTVDNDFLVSLISFENFVMKIQEYTNIYSYFPVPYTKNTMLQFCSAVVVFFLTFFHLTSWRLPYRELSHHLFFIPTLSSIHGYSTIRVNSSLLMKSWIVSSYFLLHAMLQ